MEKGWIRLHRKISNNPLWFLEPFTKAQAWIDLVLHANHKKGTISIRGNIITIARGQIAWSEVTMSKRWRWSRNKVRRFLKWLETEQQIEQQQDRYITTIITIINYDIYQGETANDTAERQQKDSRRYINNNDKNVKEVLPKGKVSQPTKKKEYGNRYVNELIKYLQRQFGLPRMDGTVRGNRNAAANALRKLSVDHKTIDEDSLRRAKTIVDIGAKKDYWRSRIASMQDFYKNMVKISLEARTSKPHYGKQFLEVKKFLEGQKHDA